AKASIFAAILVFASPVIGKDGISAYNDMMVATLIYAVFYLLQVWDESPSYNLLILIGLLSGSSYGVKYTAFLTLPFAAGWIAYSAFWGRKSGAKSSHWVSLGQRRFLGALLVLVLPAIVMVCLWV